MFWWKIFNEFNESTCFLWPVELRLLHSTYVMHICALDFKLRKGETSLNDDRNTAAHTWHMTTTYTFCCKGETSLDDDRNTAAHTWHVTTTYTFCCNMYKPYLSHRTKMMAMCCVLFPNNRCCVSGTNVRHIIPHQCPL